MPDTDWNYWNLIKFNEDEHDDGSFAWLMRKHQCMHCADPGCLRACPADGAIVQYSNGIVDFQQENCIGCQFCVSGCPFNIPKFNPETKKVYKCTLCSDRVGAGLEPACIKSCPTGCLHFGTKDDMKFLAEKRATQLRDVSGFKDAGVYDPATIGGTSVIYVLHNINKPEAYGDLPKKPRISPAFTIWKDIFKPIGLFGAMLGFVGVVMHYVFEGPLRTQPHSAGERNRCRQQAWEGRTRWRPPPIVSFIVPTPSIVWARPWFMPANCCAIRCTRASCTGWSASSSFSLCCPDSESTCRGSSASSRRYLAAAR